MEKKIKVLIKKDKSLYLDTENFKGETCVKEIKKLFNDLLDLDTIENKSDYYEFDENLANDLEIKL